MAKHHSSQTLAAYGALGLPLAALGLPLVVFLPPYYAQMPALNTGLVGILIVIARLFDVVSDPLIGSVSDRVHTRFGRRLPWIAGGTPILMLAAWFLFVPGPDPGAAYLLISTIAAYLGWTLIYLPYTTLGAELSTDYDERSRITAWREGFFVLGTLVAIVLPIVARRTSGIDGSGLEALAVFLVLALPVATYILLRQISEGGLTPQPATNWREGARLLVANGPFRRLLAAYLLNGAANGLPAALFMFFVISILGASQLTAGIFLVIYFLAGVVGLPVWLRIGRRWSKHRLWCATMLFVSVVFPTTLMFSANTASIVGYVLVCIFGGSTLGIDQAMAASIQADVIDEDTAAGGNHRAGLYFGLWGMATKLAFALSLGVAYPLLWVAGFEAGAEHNGATALWTLSLVYGLLPVLVKLGVVRLMWHFPLDRRRHTALRQAIDTQTPGESDPPPNSMASSTGP